MDKLRAAVFMGGRSAEREVSLSSGSMVRAALPADRYNTYTVDTGQDGWERRFVAEPLPDVAVLCLHGPGGEDGVLQGFFQTLGVPYIGSGVMSSGLCMDKDLTKLVLRAEGIPVPFSFLVTPEQRARDGFRDITDSLPLPMVVKPNRQGSTIGTSLVTDRDQVLAAVDQALTFDAEVLLEEFAAGVEITACVVGGREPEVLPLIEIVPRSGFYDYHDKYTAGATEEIVPARIEPRRAEEARKYALAAHRRLKCWGMSRTDMIVGAEQTWVLEVNTLPGMTPTSLLPLAARSVGLSMTDLLDRLVNWARQRPAGY